jgi:hypothetical protein
VPESSLSLQLSDFTAAVGYYLGYGRTASLWTGWNAAAPYVPSSPDSQLYDIMSVVQAGLRQFYRPPLAFSPSPDGQPVDPKLPPHRWSFLSPERQLVTAQGQSDYPLPDDFGRFEGEMTFATVAAGQVLQLRRVAIGEVRRWLGAAGGAQGPPVYFAEVPRPGDGSVGQRFNVAMFPAPDQAYTLTYRCTVNPPALTATNPYPLGGMQHGETILESCLAVAESRLNDEEGVHAKKFQELLQASIAQDLQDHWPESLGWNGQQSSQARGAVASNARKGPTAPERIPYLKRV